jgi:ribosomal protein S18 acetylase RimI-like enzyme
VFAAAAHGSMHAAVTSFALTPIGVLPAGFAALRVAAAREGFSFLDRLGESWDGVCYDEDEAASVWGAEISGVLIAIGAQTHDDYDPSPMHRRIRHFYVRPDMRREGVGRALAQQLILDAFELAPRLHVRATHDAARAFWESLGFVHVARDDRSHEMVRG